MTAVKTIVTYPKGTKFDVDYYKATHFPLVQKIWGQHGLVSAELIDHAKDDHSAYSYTFIATWKDAESPRAAFADPATAQVIGDVPNFSDAKPSIGSGGVVYSI